MTPNAASGAFLAFIRRHPSGDSSQLIVHSFDEQGRQRWPPEGIVAAEGPRFRLTTPHLTGDLTGGVFACFAVFTSRSDIRCQHLDAAGRPMWGTAGLDVGLIRGNPPPPTASSHEPPPSLRPPGGSWSSGTTRGPSATPTSTPVWYTSRRGRAPPASPMARTESRDPEARIRGARRAGGV